MAATGKVNDCKMAYRRPQTASKFAIQAKSLARLASGLRKDFDMNAETILTLSPDDASTKNAQALANAKKWQHLGAYDDEKGEMIWGEIKGSSGETYHTKVALDAEKFDCSCPSRKRPCKHALGLALLREKDASVFRESPPTWVQNDETPAPNYNRPKVGDEKIVPLELPESWKPALDAELEKPYFQELRAFVESERGSHTIYPPSGEEFAALEATPYDQVKVFILGQDPYFNPNQAHGMAFSVKPGVKPPPSLLNMFKELQDELGVPVSKDGYLMPWAKQGVLLLNAVLTVRQGVANSHKSKGWEKFTDAVIRAVSDKEKKVIFVLWGAYAQKKEKLIDTDKHIILKSAHPSPLSAHNGFFGSKPFTQINRLLEENGQKPIDWDLSHGA
ncbi:uracil-DNA glycosylase [bacterium]|nr:MAG: uracil-DNA glycosylase [bacterium]